MCVIIWGEKIKRKRRGQAVRFCAVCRGATVMKVVEVRKVGHFYYIPLGFGSPIADETTCTACRTVGAFEARTVVATRGRIIDAESAMRALPEAEAAALHARMDLEARALAGRATQEERAMLLVEPFAALGYELERRVRLGAEQSILAVLQLLAICFGFGAFGCWVWFSESRPRDRGEPLVWAIGMTLLTVAMVGLIIWRSRTGSRRAARRLLGRLAGSLRPLSPTREEIEGLVTTLRGRGLPMGAVDAGALVREIEGTAPALD